MENINRVEKYINSNINLLEESKQENALNFNLARLHFYKKEFDTVLTFLNRVNYDDIWYNINSKILLLATYYELNEIEPLFSSIDSYTAFLRREKSLDNTRKQRHLNFTTNLKKIINFQDQRLKLSKVKESIIDSKTIVNKEWLLEKIDALL